MFINSETARRLQKNTLKEEYTTWLVNFIKAHKIASDFHEDKCNEVCTGQDKINLGNLSLFSTLAMGYANRIGLEVTYYEGDDFYSSTLLNLSCDITVLITLRQGKEINTRITLVESERAMIDLQDLVDVFIVYASPNECNMKTDVNKQETQSILPEFLKNMIEKEKQVLKDDYIDWLVEFIKREEAFDDEANRVEYCGKYTEDEKKKIHLVSNLYSIISKYYDKNGIEYDVLKSTFFNQAVTVNLTADISIEMRLWCGQGSVTDVSLIEAYSGKVDIQDVVAFCME